MIQQNKWSDKIELVYSNRKTISIEIHEDLRIVVRAPKRISRRELQQFLDSRRDWLETHYARMQERAEQKAKQPQERILLEHPERWYREQAARILAEQVAYYAEKMQVTYGRITIRNQKTRWGSCSSLGNLSFNWKLILLDPQLLEYVVVHELAHRIEMNHSPAFWAVVAQTLPDYQERRMRLKAEHPV